MSRVTSRPAALAPYGTAPDAAVAAASSPKHLSESRVASSVEDLPATQSSVSVTQTEHLVRPDSGLGGDKAGVQLAGRPIAPTSLTMPRSFGEAVALMRSRELRDLLVVYSQLSKARLAALVLMSTGMGYGLAPLNAGIQPATLAAVSVGTALSICSANTINQWIERDHDLLMKRTLVRPLPEKRISANHALGFGLTTGIVGVSMLKLGVNDAVAIMGLGNLLLYTSVYTPLKRRSQVNTWVGGIVGAVPPVMGWAAATGGDLGAGAWILAATLYAWQIPHFYALAHNLRHDYAAAGHKMLSSTDPARAALWSYRYTAGMMALAPLSSLVGLTTPEFALDGALVTLPLLYQAKAFLDDQTPVTSRRLFFGTLYWLPAFAALMFWDKM